MLRLALVLAVSFGSVVLGYLVQRLFRLGKGDVSRVRRSLPAEIAGKIRLITVAGLIPWPILFTFWRVSQTGPELIILPVLGVLSLCLGGAASLLMIRLSRPSPEKAGALFVSGTMTNLGVIGGLFGMMIFGNEGYLTVQLFIMFESVVYYLVVFPLSHQIGRGRGALFVLRPGLLLSRPLVFVPVIAIAAGFILKGFDVPSPDYIDQISMVMVPMIAGLIGISIGLTLRVSKLRLYVVESIMISVIKFVVIPALIIPAAVLLGLPGLLNGAAFKTVIILSFGPVALIASVPAQLYGLDLDLVNSGWLLTTVLNLLIVPVLILILT